MLRGTLQHGRRILRQSVALYQRPSVYTPRPYFSPTAVTDFQRRLLSTEKDPKGNKDETKPGTVASAISAGDKPEVKSETTTEAAKTESAEAKSTAHHTEGKTAKKTELPKAAANIGSAVSHNIASTLHFTQHMYDEFEKNAMRNINYKNQQRFRAYLLGTVLLIAWVSLVFGERMRKYFTEQTAGLAKETLENESLKIQTQELATAVVQTILENKDIASHAAAFLKEASTVPETQQAMLKLTLHILQHKETLDELTKISQKLIKNLANDKDMINELSRLLEKVLADPDLKAALVTLVGQLCQDKEVFASVSDLVVKLGAEERVTTATSQLLTGSVSDVMKDEQINQQSKKFISDVVGDDLLQKEGGHALWQSVKYALQPGIIRVTGVTLVAVSVGFAKLMLSPY